MKKREIQLTKEFKTQTVKAISTIGLFLISYLIILFLAILFTGLCIAGGFFMISIKPIIAVIFLGVGLASLGFLILIFLLKFVFKTHKVDRSNLIEINEQQQPDLFMMIREIVHEVGTGFPKKVYISSEVNASVFYDSNFWSMFLPIKKNLQIGLGLVNTVTKEELKAILSHEFGHFSQKTMKVGSYVYNVNQVIFNMLYDNQSYENLVQKWANISQYFSLFVMIAVKINEGIQWVLKKLYDVVNKNYMALSREMEFHADEIAASVTGYLPLKKSLLRMALADNSFSNVLNFYNEKIAESTKTENLYKDQTAVMHFIAGENQIRLENQLPIISLEDQSRFDKSKLVIENQWASHPTVEERIKRLEKTGYTEDNESGLLANSLFKNIDTLQKQFTKTLFDTINYKVQTTIISSDQFIEEYKQKVLSDSFSKSYNGYYDKKNPANFDLNTTTPYDEPIEFEELFSIEKIDLVYTALGLQNDIETLKELSNNTNHIKTFDYDGIRYQSKNTDNLIKKLKVELEVYNKQIKLNDAKIFHYFINRERQLKKSQELEKFYFDLFEFDKIFDAKYELYSRILNKLHFVSASTSFDEINSNFNNLKRLENDLKQEIKKILSDVAYETIITNEIKQNLDLYISKSWMYFNGNSYENEHLSVLYKALDAYAYLLTRRYFLMKKKILSYQEDLMPHIAKLVN